MKKKKLVTLLLGLSLIILNAVPSLAATSEVANEPTSKDFPAPSSYNPKLSTANPLPGGGISPQVIEVPPPTVVIDPGHGGSDPGSVGNGLLEKNLNLSISTKLKNFLASRYAGTYSMTRTTDTFVALPDIVNFANSRNANFFISNHINASIYPSANGVETYWQKADTSQSLATNVQNELAKSGLTNRGVKKFNYYVITYTNMPSVLTETGFISNASDASKISTSSFQDTLVSEMARGIHLYWWGF